MYCTCHALVTQGFLVYQNEKLPGNVLIYAGITNIINQTGKLGSEFSYACEPACLPKFDNSYFVHEGSKV